MPDISILIPCHNAAAWLETAIESALACRGANEVIVVDDGSTDGSVAIAREFGARIKFIVQPQAGGNAARNRLVDAAQGEWLQFLDADDYLEPDKLERQMAEAGDLAACDILYSPVWEETWRDGRAVSRTPMALDPTADLSTQWIRWHLPQTGGALWRAAALRRIGKWDPAMPCCQEHELYLRALEHDLRWKFCPTPGAVYRLWSENTVCRKDPARVLQVRTALIDRLLNGLERNGELRAQHRIAAHQTFFEMARTWARYDLPAARNYVRERGSRLALRGPAAPLSYRLAYRTLGFARAERLARCLR